MTVTTRALFTLLTCVPIAATAGGCGKRQQDEPAAAKGTDAQGPGGSKGAAGGEPVRVPDQPAAAAGPPVAKANPPPAKDEPWRTTPPTVAADIKCPESWWLIIDASSFPPAELAARIDQGHARPAAAGGGIAVKLANYELPADPDAWSAPDKPGRVSIGFTLVAKKGGLVPGIYGMGSAGEKLRLVSPGVGFDRGPTGSGGIGWQDKPGPTVEVTAIDDHQVCGRVNIDDGYSAVRGAFTVPRLPR